jgi:hypothetical protein
MLQDAHTRKVSIPVSASAGADTVVIAAVADAWIYVHELIGDLSATGVLTVLTGSDIRGVFNLDDGQGLTLQDEAGEDGRPRFECKPGDAFILRTTGGNFIGSCHYSLRY